MSCQNKLVTLIANNFVVYFKSHVYHLNITGPNFPQYHALLQEVYDYLWENHDTLNEQLRQMGVMCPTSLKDYADETDFSLINKAKSDKEMLKDLCEHLETLNEVAQILYNEVGSEGHGALETYIGDYMTGVSKLKWKVESSL